MKTFNELNVPTRHWMIKSMQWADQNWNNELSLIRIPVDHEKQSITARNQNGEEDVRNSIWYATGLLMRQNPADVKRALKIIDAILKYQFDDPEKVFHGTFYRNPSESYPPEDPIQWDHYDPNWREFICTVFIVLITEFQEVIPKNLIDRMNHSIMLAAQGSYERQVSPEYTNISLMSTFLLDFAGRQFNNNEWKQYALNLGREIHRLFERNKTFNEFNSPTYYGVDFYALALWRKYGSSTEYQNLGNSMELDLWRDVAQFYHAEMRNLCGPYDRSYGMDMQNYIASVGLWISTIVPVELAPLPNTDQPFNHSGDYYFFPMVALLETNIPNETVTHFKEFQGEKFLSRTIEPKRTASSWLSENLMLGTESNLLSTERPKHLSNQFHPATAHWFTSGGNLAWLSCKSNNPLNINCSPNVISLSSSNNESCEYIFEINAPNISPSMVDPYLWRFPGMTISLKRTNTPFFIKHFENQLTIQFSADGIVELTFEPSDN